MASVALRPRTPSEIVDAAFQILRAHYPQFVMCSALAYLPWLIAQLIMASDPTVYLRVTWAGAVFGVGIWLIFALMSAVLIVCASQAYLGEPVDVAAAVRKAFSRLPVVLLGALLRYICMLAGLVALLVGALYVGARLFAMTPVIVLENEGVAGAFSRSSFLSLGRKRHIINTLGLVAVIYWVLALGVQLAAALIGGAVVQAIVTAIYTIMVYPVVGITEAVLYYDTRIKSEGLDIELMASALDVAPPRESASP
jgi:hypothetical protein